MIKKIIFILAVLSISVILMGQNFEFYLTDASGNPISLNGSSIVGINASAPTGTTVNETIDRGFTAGDITTNNGTGDLLWSEQVFDDLQTAGVKNIRIVFWYANDSGSSPWTITPSVLTNLAIIVDKLNAHGMIAIIDYHQPMLKRDNLYTQDNIDRWVSHWGQIANHFSSYDSLDVVYEPLNEPEYDALAPMTLSDWNTMQQDVINEIRLYDTEKSIFITSYQWSKLEYLSDMVVPTDPSNRLILSIHYYDPKWRHDITTWPNIWPLWYNLEYQFAELEAWLAANPNIDVTIGEWGNKLTTPTPARQDYTRMLANFFDSKGWSASWWDLKAWEFEAYLDGSGWITEMRDAILTDELGAFEAYDSTQLYVSNFSSTTDGWTTWTELGGAVNLSVAANELVVNVTNGSTGGTNSVIVRTPALTVTQGKLYRVSYDIRGTYTFLADHLNAAHNWWNIDELNGGGTFTRTFTYEQTAATVASNYVQFYVGGSTGTFYISNMRIEEITYPAAPVAWVDSITMLQYANWDNLTAQTNPPHTMLDDVWDDVNYIGGELDAIFQTLAIVNTGSGDMALQSIFPQDQCCVEYDAAGNGGTGALFYIWLEPTIHTEYQEVWFTQKLKFDANFYSVMGNGVKIPGVEAFGNNLPQRLMFLNQPGGMEMQFYSATYPTDTSNDHVRVPSLAAGVYIPMDTEFELTQCFYSDASNGGFHEVYIDGIMVARRTSMRYNNSVNPTHYWDGGNFSLFAGGDIEAYQFSADSNHESDDHAFWTEQSNTITNGSVRPIGYDISDMLEAVHTFF